MDDEPTIVPTPILPEDFTDGATDDSSPEAERRKYQRGGRKVGQRQKKLSRMAPVPEPEPSLDLREGETLEEFNERFANTNGETKPAHREEPTNGDLRDAEAEREEQNRIEPEVICDKCKQKTTRPKSPFKTGFKSFNVKRAQNSDARPFGVKATSKGKKPKKSAPKKKKKKKKAKEEVEEEEESESSGDDNEEEEQEEEEEEDEDRQKPVSIRLDLNLMVEIFLKAKIKGDVTITFLQ